jgi:cytochrome P450
MKHVATWHGAAPATARGHEAPGPPVTAVLRVLRGLGRDSLPFLETMHAQYGDVVRLPLVVWNVYLLRHPEHVKHVLQDHHTAYDKDNFDYRMLKPILGEGLLTANGEHWLRQRRLMQPAFHRERIAGFARLMVDRTQALLERWRPAADRGEPLRIRDEMTRLTADIVTRALFGVEIAGEAEAVAESFTVLNRSVVAQFEHPFLALLPLPTLSGRVRRAARTLDEVVRGIIARRRAAGTDAGDLLSMLLDARDEESAAGMTEQQLRDEVMTLLLAGHETTANALSWTWHLLGRFPEAGERVAAELDEVLGDREPTADDLPRLSCTRRTIEESLRLYPPAWIISRSAREEDEIGGFRIPRRSIVALSPWITHRDPRFWNDPERFDPDRFLPERMAARPRFAYFPFAGGPRQCIGNGFAMTEATLVLATIARRYRLEPLSGRPVEPDPLVTLRPRSELSMIPRPRRATSPERGAR